jgi:putative transposase
LEFGIDFWNFASLQPPWCSSHKSRNCLRCASGLKFVAYCRRDQNPFEQIQAGCVADRSERGSSAETCRKRRSLRRDAIQIATVLLEIFFGVCEVRLTLLQKRLGVPQRQDGEAVSEKRVRRLMREEGLQGKVPKRFKQTTDSRHADPIAANLLDRDFTAAAPNQRWVGDTTEFVIGEGGAKLYLAAILDPFSRFVVGWAISAVNDHRLTLKALEMAVRRRCPEPGLLHHSDRGCTYTCEDYQAYLATQGITCSMSRRADCYDNAVMESFFATVKKEEADRFPSYSDAKMALFDYIEVFYNQRRRHSTLGQISPAAFERGAPAA